MGHARALVAITDEKKQIEVYRSIVEQDLSVRQAEALAKQVMRGGPTKPVEPKKIELSYDQQRFRSDLEIKFRTKVAITKDEKGAGKMLISFKNDEELNRIMKLMAN